MRKILSLLIILLFMPFFTAEKFYCEVLDEDLVRQNITEQGDNFKIEFRDAEDNLIGICRELLNGRGNITFIEGEGTDIRYAEAFNATHLPNKKKLFCEVRGNIIQIKWTKLASPSGEDNFIVSGIKNFFGRELYMIILDEQEAMSGMGKFEKFSYIMKNHLIEIVFSLFTNGFKFLIFGFAAAWIIFVKTKSFMEAIGALLVSGGILSFFYHVGLLLGAIFTPQYCYYWALGFLAIAFLCLITVTRKVAHHLKQSQKQTVILNLGSPLKNEGKGEENSY